MHGTKRVKDSYPAAGMLNDFGYPKNVKSEQGRLWSLFKITGIN
jgi:hypothetical protein